MSLSAFNSISHSFALEEKFHVLFSTHITAAETDK